MKFKFCLNEAIKKKEFASTLNDPYFNVGAEFEFVYHIKNFPGHKNNFSQSLKEYHREIRDFILGEIKDKFKNYYPTIPLKWECKYDGSIEPNDPKREMGAEIVTPPYTLGAMLEIIPEVFKYISKNGYTNNTCGLHIGISHKSIDPKLIDQDVLASQLEDPRIYATMPSRKQDPDDPFAYAGSSEVEFKNYGTITGTKYRTLYPHEKYVEFRGMGGTDYEKKWGSIRPIIINYAAKYKKSYSQDISTQKRFKKKQYKIEQDKEEFFKNLEKSGNWLLDITQSPYFLDFKKWWDPNKFDWSSDDSYKLLFNKLSKGLREYRENFKVFDKIIAFVRDEIISSNNLPTEKIQLFFKSFPPFYIKAILNYSFLNNLYDKDRNKFNSFKKEVKRMAGRNYVFSMDYSSVLTDLDNIGRS